MLDEYERVNELKQKAASLQKVLDAAKEEYEAIKGKRRKLLEKAASMKADAEAAAEKRDAANKEVRDLGEKIGGLLKAKSETEAEIERKAKELREARTKLPGGEEYLKRKLRELEWKLITAGVPFEEEAEIVSSIAELHRKLAPYEKAKGIVGELGKLKERHSELKIELGKLLEEKGRLVGESRKHHESFLQAKEKRSKALEEAEKMRGEASRLKAQIEEKFMELLTANAEIALHESKMRKSREDAEREKRRAEETTKAQVAQAAAEKLRRGESVGWEEFKIYMERNSGG
ncbi:MAG: hypothetical protein JTT11_07145 [Candidatus Brockarchaeota archaeon]|nr:hypothetical protein [Candidatus Brockarchaeota archaeon]